jgi:hypothetical protein
MLLVFGVLLGLIALVVDVGLLYVEREELQSGADAAVVAVAKACSLDTDDCADIGAIESLAQQYANDNARDNVTGIAEICGRLPGILQPCTTPASNLTACLNGPDNPPEADLYVEVRVHTEMSNGDFALPPAFAQAMAGNGNFDGVQVGACARASWEPAEEVTVLAMTISTCEFATATNGGTDFADPPPYPPNPSPDDEYTIDFPTNPPNPTVGHPECEPDPPGPDWDEPGPAAWLDGNSSCEITMPGNGEVSGSDAFVGSPPASCLDRIRDAINRREILYVPVHDAREPGTGATEYRVISVAPVVFAGFHLGPDPADDEVSWVSGSIPCTDPAERCVSGLFVGPRIPIGNLHGDAIVTLIG